MKTFIKRTLTDLVAVSLYLTGCGILDAQDEAITRKNRAVFAVRASNDQLKFDLCFAQDRDYSNTDLNHFCRGSDEKS